MKKLFVFLSFLFASHSINAQHPRSRLNVRGFFGVPLTNCESRLTRITANFRSGNSEIIFRSGISENSLREFNSLDFDYDNSDPLVSIDFFSQYVSGSQCFGDILPENNIIPISRTDCFNQRYRGSRVFSNSGQSPILSGFEEPYAIISVTPIIEIRNNSNALINGGIEVGCLDDEINLITNSVPSNGDLTWEVYDPNIITEIPHPDYLDALNYVNETERSDFLCNARLTGDQQDGSHCIDENIEAGEAQDFLDEYIDSGAPLTLEVPTWRRIEGKSSSAITLALAEIYPDPEDQRNFTGQNILLRVNPECYTGTDLDNNTFSVQYLPGTPNFARQAETTPPQCSYTADASFKLFFDRQINSDEDLFINLIDTDSNRSIGSNRISAVNPNDGIATVSALIREPDGTYSHTWNGALGAGNYSVEVTGFIRSVSGLTCQILTQNFSIAAPSQVEFTAVKVRDEVCVDENNGQIRITAIGGTPPYEYTLNNGGSWQNLPATNYIVDNLRPNTYNVQVRDANGCLDKVNAADADRNVSITINAATSITHTFTGNPTTQTSGPGASNGRVRVSSVNGGVPRQEGVRRFYDYRILTVSPNITGRADVTGFDILGLPAGVHRIQYTDANGCEQVYNLPEIEDPLPISFAITNTRNPSCDAASDGVLTIVPSGGVPPYNFSWINTNAPIQSGNDQTIEGGEGSYTVVVTDSGTGRAEQTNIRFQNIPAPLNLITQVAPVLCFDDLVIVTLNASGGSGDYEYAQVTGGTLNWGSANRFSLPYSASGYVFRARDRNATVCQTDRVATGAISQPTPLDTSVLANGIVNNTVNGASNGAIAISVSGGVPPYTITWERDGTAIANRGQSISSLPAGRYIARIEDANSCAINSTPIEITEPDRLTVGITGNPIACFEGNTTLNANAQGGIINNTGAYSYQWFFNGEILVGETNASLTNATIGNYSVRVNDDYTSNQANSNITQPAQLRLTLNGTNISCFNGTDGAIELRINGGTAPYVYALDGVNFIPVNTLTDTTIRGLAAGQYTVWLQDANGCAINRPLDIELIQPETIRVEEVSNAPVTTVGGTNGSLDIQVSAGMAPYRFNWVRENDATFNATTEDITNLQQGRYTVTVTDANNCSTDASFQVNEPEPLQVTLAQNADILCFGETTAILTATVIGGFPINAVASDYELSWYVTQNGSERLLQVGNGLLELENLEVGTYRVEVRDSEGAEAETAFEVTEPEVLTLVLDGTPQNVLCHGLETGAINITVTGGPTDTSSGAYLPYTFQWTKEDDASFNATTEDLENIGAGTYNVVVTDNNLCTITFPDPIVIAEPQAALEIFGGTPVNLTRFEARNGSISTEIRGGTPPYTFVWTNSDDTQFTASTQNISNLAAGNYTLLVTDANNCNTNSSFQISEPDPLQITLAQNADIFCFGEATASLTATVTGGFPVNAQANDYELSWYVTQNGQERLLQVANGLLELDALEAGEYRVEVRDVAGAESEAIFEITEPELLALTVQGTPQDVLCHGLETGAINITVTGGPVDEATGDYLPYAFRWTKEEDVNFEAITEDLVNIGAGTYNVVVVDDNLCTVTLLEPIVITEPEAPLEIFNVEAVNLTGFQTNDGTISTEIRGGTPPYTFAWLDANDSSFTANTQNISDLTIGSYQLLVTDANNCTVNLEQQITEPELLTVRIEPIAEAQSVQCFGEETIEPLVTITEGGVAPYSYQWVEESNPDVIRYTNANTPRVPAGVYQVTVTDVNGNMASANYTIEEPEPLQLSETIMNPLCRGSREGAIDVTIVGGVPPYNYSWSNGAITEDIANLFAGNYTVTVTDANQCRLEETFVITEPLALFIQDINRVFPSANTTRDGSITIAVAGGTPPYVFRWLDANGNVQDSSTNRLQAIGSETYSVEITDTNGCSLFVEDVDLFVPPELIVTLEQINVVSCTNTSTASLRAFVTGGIPYNASKQYDYRWFNADTNSPIGEDRFLLENIAAGRYYVNVIDAVGTQTRSETFQIEEPEALQLALEADFVNCGDANDWTITTLVTGGTPPYRYDWSSGDDTPQVTALIAGTYTLEVTDSRGCTVMRSITPIAPDTLIADVMGVNPTCFGGCDGAVLMEVQGGTPPYAYNWNTGATTQSLSNSCAGSYDVVITDSKGCSISRQVELENPEELIVDLGEDVVLCAQQSAILDATIQDANASYVWRSSNGFSSTEAIVTVSTTGEYSVEVTNSEGCVAVGRIFVEAVSDVISANFLTSSQVFVGQEFVIVDNSDPFPDTLEWIFPEEAIIQYQDNNYAELYFDAPGEYEITLATQRGLCNATQTKRIVVLEKAFEEGVTEETDTASNNVPNIQLAYSLYPNPSTNGTFNAEITLDAIYDISIKVFGLGSNVAMITERHEGRSNYTLSFDVSRFPSGIYFVLLETEGHSQIRKLVIN